MKPKHWLAFASALTGCAVAYGFHLIGRLETERPQTSGKTPAAKERRAAGFKSISNPAGPQRVRPSSRQQPDRSAAALAANSEPPAPRRNIEGSPDRNTPLMAESQWRENAARVEMEANHELNRLATLLDLDPVQQDQVFASVARQSPYWLPGMQAGGVVRSTDGATGQASTDGSPNKNRQPATQPAAITPGRISVNSPQPSAADEAPDFTAYLNSDQQQTLIQEEMDRRQWWEEMLPQLLPPGYGQATAAAAAAGELEAAAPEIKEFDGGEELLEE